MSPKAKGEAFEKAGMARKVIAKARKKKKRRKKESYSIYIHKVLKRIHPDSRITVKAMSIMNSIVNDILDCFGDVVIRRPRRITITNRDIRTATRLLMRAVVEGTKAVKKYTSSK